MWKPMLAISLGSALGTLSANLIGGCIAPEWRLPIITGFCGGLTTFSTFSAEVVTLLQSGRLSSAINAIAMQVGGSLLMTLAGLASRQLLKPA